MGRLSIKRRALKRIFIASSQEARATSKRLVSHINELDEGFLAVPWWEAFNLGQYTFEDLARQTRSVDGAIIVAAKDDKVWYREKSGNRPRDNVIFEFGLFASQLGLKRTIILAEEGVELPSDLKGVTFLPLRKRDLEETANKLVQHFTEEFEKDRSGGEAPLRVVCSPELAALQISQSLPNSWFMRYVFGDRRRARLVGHDERCPL
jgi:predicted nucleotide-binding protein